MCTVPAQHHDAAILIAQQSAVTGTVDGDFNRVKTGHDLVCQFARFGLAPDAPVAAKLHLSRKPGESKNCQKRSAYLQKLVHANVTDTNVSLRRDLPDLIGALGSGQRGMK